MVFNINGIPQKKYILLRLVHVRNRYQDNDVEMPFGMKFNKNYKLRYPGIQIEGLYDTEKDARRVVDSMSSEWLPKNVKISYKIQEYEEFLETEEYLDKERFKFKNQQYEIIED
jgi:hypothetical protein